MVELGAGTMLPSLAVALNYEQSTCFAADFPVMQDHLEKTFCLNGRPTNLIPMAFRYGNAGTSLQELEKNVKKLGLKRINYVVCVDQIHDAKLFLALL